MLCNGWVLVPEESVALRRAALCIECKDGLLGVEGCTALLPPGSAGVSKDWGHDVERVCGMQASMAGGGAGRCS